MAVPHADPRIGAAVKAQVDNGSHFAAAGAGSTAVASELRRRFGLPKWCFSNSGNEAVMDAIRIARAATGKDMILKIEGGYHGDYDPVMVSVYPSLDKLGEKGSITAVPYGQGIPEASLGLSRAIAYNDIDLLEAAIAEFGDRLAGLIMEPVMTNINVIPPRDGYLQKVRELTSESGVLLIFDEVKTGATIAAGGATERYKVIPDMVALAKAICGGYPGACVGLSEELSQVVESGAVRHFGTFNGNPLVMAAAEAALTKVLTGDAYSKFDEVNDELMRGCQAIIDSYGLPAYTDGMGAKGSVVFASERVFDYRGYLAKVDTELSRLAWHYLINSGVLISPGTETDWTLSTAHGKEENEKYLAAFEQFAAAVTAN
jgi:glutamate-1-semialdehyde 2,1-aminomutase